MVVRLLDAGANPNARESLQKYTPLQVAQFNEHDTIVSKLLKCSDPAEDVDLGLLHDGVGCEGCFCVVSERATSLRIALTRIEHSRQTLQV